MLFRSLPLPELWEAVKWAVKPNGAVLFFAQCPFDKVLGASNLAMLRYEWIWYKERGTGFLNANRAPLKKSENILVFYQKSPVYNPQFTYGKPYTRVHSRSGTSSNYGKFERQGSESNDGRRYPGNVLFVPTVSGGIHPCLLYTSVLANHSSVRWKWVAYFYRGMMRLSSLIR